jgi:large subunit ribosomal protein L10
MSKEFNEIAVRELKANLRGARAMVIINHQGVDAYSLDVLRHRLREAKARYRVVKNTIARLAVREVGLGGLDEFLVGSTAFAFTDEEIGQLARMLLHFAGEQERFTIKGGIFQDRVLKREEIELWATLPDRGEILSLLVAGLKAPYTGLAMALGRIIRKLVCVVELVKEKKGSG